MPIFKKKILFYFYFIIAERRPVFTYTVFISCLVLKESYNTPPRLPSLPHAFHLKKRSNLWNYFLQCTYRWSRCIRFWWITVRGKDTFYFLFLNIQSPSLNSLRLSVVSSISRHRRARAPRRWQPRFIFPFSHSTHSTFPMQIWRHPGVYLKRYARYSLFSPPTHPGTWLSRGASLYDTVVLITTSERHKPGNGCAELLTPADFFWWWGSLHRVEADKQASAWCNHGGVQLWIETATLVPPILSRCTNELHRKPYLF